MSWLCDPAIGYHAKGGEKVNVDRALVLLFPHKYIVDGLIGELSRIGAQSEVPLLKLVEQVEKLRAGCGRTYVVVARFRETQVELSDAFSPGAADVILDSGVQIRLEGLLSDDPKELVWEPEKPDYASLIASIHEPEVVIGGFHWVDCVFNCFMACEEEGKKTWAAPWATDCGFVHHGLAHLGRNVMDDLPELADFDALAALLRHYLAIIDYPDE